MQNFFNRLTSRLTSIFTLICYIGLFWLVPLHDAAASAMPQMVQVNVGGTMVSYPKADFTEIGTANLGPNPSFDIKSLSGERARVSLDKTASILGASSKQVADVVNSVPTDSSIVYGNYSPLNSELQVMVVKARHIGNTVKLYRAFFTPAHGNMWAAQRTYMTPAEKAASPGPGPNPFAAFDAGDSYFHNINMAAAMSVLGHAARYYGAGMAILNVAQSRINQWTTSSGRFIVKTTYHFQGLIKPDWYIGLPQEMQPEGAAAAGYCLVSQSPCPAYKRALSYMSFKEWTGGNLPHDEQQSFYAEESHSSLSVLVFALIIAVLCVVTAGAILAASGQMWGVIQSVMTSIGIASTSITGYLATTAALATLAYIGGAAVLNGASSPYDVQSNVFGSIPSGTAAPPAMSNQYSVDLQNSERQIAINAAPGQSGYSNFDSGYNTVRENMGQNYNFNDWEYVQDTK